MASAMWKAELTLGRVSVPVKLYAAVQDRDVHFRLLHARDHVPVKQQMVDPRSGEEVSDEEIRRGLELEEGVFVVLTEEDLASAEPPASRSIDVTRFVPASAVDPGWYRRPYLLGPDGKNEDYFALARALADSELVGIASWVMRKRFHTGVLSVHGDYLSLIALHDASDVVTADALKPRSAAAAAPVAKGEQQLAEQLISALDAEFEPQALQDDYQKQVRALIAARAKGRAFKMPKESVSKPRPDLEQALRDSLKAAKERRDVA